MYTNVKCQVPKRINVNDDKILRQSQNKTEYNASKTAKKETQACER